jgi:cytochrome c peroxidase
MRLRSRTLATLLFILALPGAAAAQESLAAHVRQEAEEAGMGSLDAVEVPRPTNLDEFLKPGSDAERAAIQLGKALFWDMQVGSDGQACASCHYHAGADHRAKNQLSPGMRNADGSPATAFGPMVSGRGGANYTLTAEDFPFHLLEDRQDRASPVVRDTDDVCSSQGVFAADFAGIVKGKASERGRETADPVFNVAGVNVRRVEPRNAPSVVNAVFNAVNFWDGRAHHVFNGVNGAGPLDPMATILVTEGKKTLVRRPVRIDNASLASQAVEPPGSHLEMAYAGRTFRDLARKLFALKPLGLQLVHPHDSVLGPLARAKLSRGRVAGRPGLSVDYDDLIKRAFQPRYWEWKKKVDGYTQMEHNFSLFFGLAIQLYESTLVADDSPFDDFMEGDDDELTEAQLEGLLIFMNDGTQADPIFVRLGQGNCLACHRGPELTNTSVRNLAERGATTVTETPELILGVLVDGPRTAFADVGFSNIGVRPTAEDLGRGGLAFGLPLALVGQSLLGSPFAPPLPACGGIDQLPCPENDRTAVNGAFKVPSLRNVELTGPYMHNGGQATLRQVVAFYERLGDFSNGNVRDLDAQAARIDMVEKDEQPLVEFLRSLTDERVAEEREPFDHPQLFVPHGHPGDEIATAACGNGLGACDDRLEIPPVGRHGRRAAGLAPLGTFLGLDPLDL